MAAWSFDGGGAVTGPLDGVVEKVETARPLGYCLLSCPSCWKTRKGPHDSRQLPRGVLDSSIGRRLAYLSSGRLS
jgi:hypothetical protein